MRFNEDITWARYLIIFSRPVFGPPEEERGFTLQAAAGNRVKCLKE